MMRTITVLAIMIFVFLSGCQSQVANVKTDKIEREEIIVNRPEDYRNRRLQPVYDYLRMPKCERVLRNCRAN